jgi:F-box and WD-40 domain protein CDC4
MSNPSTPTPLLDHPRLLKRTKVPLPTTESKHVPDSSVLEPEPYSYCQLSYAPATKTTIVTTTTTTTTSFPPFMLQAPRDLLARDPRQYPLASTPTPSSLKHFTFTAGGRTACFDESSSIVPVKKEEVSEYSDGIGKESAVTCKYSQQQIRSKYLHGVENNNPRSTSSKRLDTSFAPYNPKKRSAPEDSDDSSQTAADTQRTRVVSKKTRHRLRGLDNAPITPRSRTMTRTRRYGHPEQTQNHQESPVSISGDAPTSAAQIEDALSNVITSNFHSLSPTTIAAPPSPPSFIGVPAGVATPPVVEQDLDTLDSFAHSENRVPSIDTSPQVVQDNSLPSPVLSPVTALASPLPEDLQFDERRNSIQIKDLVPFPQQDTSIAETQNPGSDGQVSAPLADMFKMVEMFDSYPVELQRYAMYQLLRRSSKGLLQFTADLVNPALKCDYLARLPTELGLNVIRHLDATSLCRAARVSRRWRELIDSDDQVWRDLIQQEGFTLPNGEIERAVREGWKWQGLQPAEKDLSQKLLRRSRSLSALPITDRDYSESSAQMKRGIKRRAELLESTKKRRKTTRGQDDYAFTNSQYGRTSSPIDLQALTADLPELGLKSLRVPHLYKSIFRRHHGFRSSWMDPETKPQHIAFQAHGRHVVTCLQFDNDKILTGSDDTKINVWDTNTGASLKQLNGHEGGVWALQYDGDMLVSGSTDRTVRIWDVEKGRCLHVFQGHTSTVRCLVILKPTIIGHETDGTPIMMPKEPLIITGSRDSTLRVWKLPKVGDTPFNPNGDIATTDDQNPYFIRALLGHIHSVRAIAAHGDTLVSGSYDASVRVWRISNGDLVHRLIGHTQKVYSVILDHERNRCISGSMDNLVKVWSLETGQCIFNLEGHSSLVGLLDLNHDRLVSAAADWTLRVWDPETGHCRNVLSAHTGAITCFQHDSMKVVSGSDRTLKMWNVKNGELVRDLLTDLSGGWQIRFNDRKCVAAVQRRNRTYIEVCHLSPSFCSILADN